MESNYHRDENLRYETEAIHTASNTTRKSSVANGSQHHNISIATRY